MSRGEHVTRGEAKRIREMAVAGLSRPEISRKLRRSKSTVWRVLQSGLSERKAESTFSACSLETKSPSYLETGIAFDCANQEVIVATADEIRTNFIEALNAHFVVRRRAPDRFVDDLTGALIEERFSVPVLRQAANMFVKTRTASSFPSVAACIGMCFDAQEKLRLEKVALDA